MGSQPQVTTATDGSSVEVTGFAMESEKTPASTIMEMLKPTSHQPSAVYGFEAYVRNQSAAVSSDNHLGLTLPVATKSNQGISMIQMNETYTLPSKPYSSTSPSLVAYENFAFTSQSAYNTASTTNSNCDVFSAGAISMQSTNNDKMAKNTTDEMVQMKVGLKMLGK